MAREKRGSTFQEVLPREGEENCFLLVVRSGRREKRSFARGRIYWEKRKPLFAWKAEEKGKLRLKGPPFIERDGASFWKRRIR